MPEAVRKVVERIGENCEPALCTVLFIGGAGGSLRSGVTENPVSLTRSCARAITRVTCGGAPVYIYPGGGITFMVDVTRLPKNSFGYVPTPALVAPLEFTMRRGTIAALGGHIGYVRAVLEMSRFRRLCRSGRRSMADRRIPAAARVNVTSNRLRRQQFCRGKRLHLQHGPIDLVIAAEGEWHWR